MTCGTTRGVSSSNAARVVGSLSNARAIRSRTLACSTLPAADTIRFGATYDVRK